MCSVFDDCAFRTPRSEGIAAGVAAAMDMVHRQQGERTLVTTAGTPLKEGSRGHQRTLPDVNTAQVAAIAARVAARVVAISASPSGRVEAAAIVLQVTLAAA